jgi:hypothetical protein
MSSVDDAAGVQKQLADHKARPSFFIEEMFEQMPEAIVVFDEAFCAAENSRARSGTG